MLIFVSFSHQMRHAWVGLYPLGRELMQAEICKLFLEQPRYQGPNAICRVWLPETMAFPEALVEE